MRAQPEEAAADSDPLKPFEQAERLYQVRIEPAMLEAAELGMKALANAARQVTLDPIGPAIRLIEDAGGVELELAELLQGRSGLPAMLGPGVKDR